MIYQGEQFILDTRFYSVVLNGENLSVEPQVFDLLVYLINNRDRVVTRDELLDNLWPGRVVTESALNGRLKVARKVIGDDGKQQKVIKTVHRRGYQFIADIEIIEDPDGPRESVATIPFDASGKPSLAVLRFTNLSDDAEQEYFSEGITMNITSGLGRINRITIKSGFSYDLKQISPVEVARELEVDYLLTGAVQKEGKRVRIFTELLEGVSGETKWSQRYDRHGSGVIEIQDEITTNIISTLFGYRGKVGELAYERIIEKPALQFGVYDLVLKGIHHKECHTAEDNREAHRCFEQALVLEPDNSEALGWNAFVHVMDVYMGWSKDSDQSVAEAFSQAHRGIAANRLSEISHWALAMCHDFEGSTEKALEALEKASNINPNNPDYLVHKGEALAINGQAEEGIAIIQHAMKLRLDFPEWYWWHMGIALFAGERYLDCRDAFNRMSDHNDATRLYLAASNALVGDLDEAALQFAELLRLNSDFEPDDVRDSHRGFATRILDNLIRGVKLAASQLPDSIRLVR